MDSIMRDMMYLQSILRYKKKYGVSRASRKCCKGWGLTTTSR